MPPLQWTACPHLYSNLLLHCCLPRKDIPKPKKHHWVPQLESESAELLSELPFTMEVQRALWPPTLWLPACVLH